jgi:hypothetical protein
MRRKRGILWLSGPHNFSVTGEGKKYFSVTDSQEGEISIPALTWLYWKYSTPEYFQGINGKLALAAKMDQHRCCRAELDRIRFEKKKIY